MLDSPFNNSFPHKNKLLKKAEFEFVFENPNKIVNRYLVALFRRSQNPEARLGMIVSKKWVKQAVQRNLVRRIMRESFRHYKKNLKKLDIIMLLRSECIPLREPLNKKKLRDDIDNLCQAIANY